jgi:hypothetical protein
MNQPTHPYHRLYLKALKAVHDHQARTGARSDDESERLAAGLVMSIKEKDRSAAYHLKLSRDRKQVTYRTHRGLVPKTKKAEVTIEQALAARTVEPLARAVRPPACEPAVPPSSARTVEPMVQAVRPPACEPAVPPSSARMVEPMAQAVRPATCEPAIPPSSARMVRPMAQAGHPDHRLYQQALEAVHRLDAEAARIPEDRREKLAASLVMSARERGLSAIHGVRLSPENGQVCVEQHRWFSCLKWFPCLKRLPCFKKTVTVDVEQALNRPLEGDRPLHGAREGPSPNSLRAVGMPEPSRSFNPPMAMAGHPDHALYQQALTKLRAEEALHPEHKRFPDEWIKKVSAALVASAREDGLKAIDRVAWGSEKTLDVDLIKIFGKQDGFFPCWRNTTQVYLGEALQMSIEDLSRRCEAARELASPSPVRPRNHQIQQAHAIVR